MERKEEGPLPRVLVNARRGYALEILRGWRYAHIINADYGTISYDRVPLEKLAREWHEYSTERSHVHQFCVVCLGSFRPKTMRAETTLREIQGMTIDVKKATDAELLEFHNSKVEEKKRVKAFASRDDAEKKVTALVASISPSVATDADAPLPPDEVSKSTNQGATAMNSKPGKSSTKTSKPRSATKKENVLPNPERYLGKKSSNPTKSAGTATATTSKKKKAAPPPAKTTKKKAAAPKKKTATSISAGVKDSWKDKKVASARAKKDKVKVGGEVFGSLMKAFKKLRLSLIGFTAFRKELKKAGRAVKDGHTFTIYHEN